MDSVTASPVLGADTNAKASPPLETVPKALAGAANQNPSPRSKAAVKEGFGTQMIQARLRPGQTPHTAKKTFIETHGLDQHGVGDIDAHHDLEVHEAKSRHQRWRDSKGPKSPLHSPRAKK